MDPMYSSTVFFIRITRIFIFATRRVVIIHVLQTKKSSIYFRLIVRLYVRCPVITNGHKNEKCENTYKGIFIFFKVKIERARFELITSCFSDILLDSHSTQTLMLKTFRIVTICILIDEVSLTRSILRASAPRNSATRVVHLALAHSNNSAMSV